MNTLQEFLQVIYPSLNDKLVSSDSLVQLDNISRLLPSASIISDAGFECHFKKESLNTDILVALAKPNRHLLIGSFDSLPDLLNSSNLWKRINKLIQKWMDKGSVVYNSMDNIWLEFDTDNNSTIPEPSLFFCPSELTYSGFKNKFERYHWMVREVLELLIDEPVSNITIEHLSKCYNLLPHGGSVFQVGVMMPRLSESKAIRLCIKDIEFSKITEYLRSVGWRDPTDNLDILVSELSVFVDRIAINVSIDNGIHPKIGLECYIDKQPSCTSQWQMLFEFMIKRNLCTDDKINGLLEWPGYIEEKSFKGIWPSNFAQASTFVYPNLRSAATRAINHIKLVYQPMEPLQAKAYLWFGHRWIKPDGSLQK